MSRPFSALTSTFVIMLAIAACLPQYHWGLGDMPTVEGIGERQIESVIAYVRGGQQRLGLER